MPVVIPALLVGLTFFLRVLFSYALRIAFAVTLGILLAHLADVLAKAPWPVRKLAGPVRDLNDGIKDGIGAFAAANETAMGAFFDSIGFVAEQTGDALRFQAAATYQAFDALIHGELPGQIKARTGNLAKRTDAAERRAREAQRTATKGIDDLGERTRARDAEQTRVYARGIDSLRAKVNTIVLPRIAALEGEFADVVGRTGRQARAFSRRIGRLEALLGAGAIAGIAVAALTRRFPYWQCRNVRRGMRGLCRMDSGVLDLLLGAGVEAFVVSDLCRFVQALSAATRAIEPELVAFASVESALLHCPAASYPVRLPAFPIALPPRQAFAALPPVGA